MSIVNLIIFLVFVFALFAWLFGRNILQAKRKRNRRFREPQFQFNQSVEEQNDDWEVVVRSAKHEKINAVETHSQDGFAENTNESKYQDEIEEDIIVDHSVDENVSDGQHASDRETAQPMANEVIILGLIANKDRPYAGYELLQALLTAGLRYGKMGIFHRHEEVSGRGATLFSLASAVAPGTFELPKMGGFATPGLTMFMEVNKLREPLQAFDLLIETAKQLVDDLGGEIWDDERKLLSDEKIALWRQRIAAMENKKQSVDLFASV